MKTICLRFHSKRQKQISKAICATLPLHRLVGLLLDRQDYVIVPLASHTSRMRRKSTEEAEAYNNWSCLEKPTGR